MAIKYKNLKKIEINSLEELDAHIFDLIEFDRVMERMVKQGLLSKKWDKEKDEYLYKRTRKFSRLRKVGWRTTDV